jgi:ribosome-binding ATPase YchF (GTP1/OBG family)
MSAARAEGRLRLEGKQYVANDGDILHVKFNL